MKSVKKIYALALVFAVILSSCFVAASALTPESVTIDFEDGTMGNITIDNSHLNAGDDNLGASSISAEYNDANFNINQTKKLYPGNNNSFHFASYFTGKSVAGFTFDSYGLNNFTASVRVVEFDATHKVQLGKSDENIFSFAPYGSTDAKTINIPLTEYIHWFTVKFDYVGKTVFASIRPYNSTVWTTPAELCTLAETPTDIAISHGFANNTASDLFCLPIDNVIIDYKSDKTVEFESNYGHLLGLTNADLDDDYANDYATFQTTVSDMDAAIAYINADAEFKADNAVILDQLNALRAYATSLDPDEVTIDFEDNSMGKITVENSALNTGTGFSDPVIQQGYNTGATKQFFPGCNNSMHLANYFNKAVDSVSIDMFFNGQYNMWEATSLIRKIEFDEHYSINVCVEGGSMHYRVFKDGAWYNEIQSKIIETDCVANEWYTFVVSYVGNDVYASAKLMSVETFSTPVKICTLDAAPADLAISTGWVEQSSSIYSLPIDNIYIKYIDQKLVEFEAQYGDLLTLTNAQLDSYYNNDYAGFKTVVNDLDAAIAFINADADLKADYPDNLTKLTALKAYAVSIDPNEVTIDFEDGTMGKITGTTDGSQIKNYFNANQNNINETKKLYAGDSNSFHFASYFGKKTITSFSFDMYGINNMSGPVRTVQLDATHKLNVGKANQTTFEFIAQDGTAVNTVDFTVTGGVNWFSVKFDYVGNKVYASVREYNSSVWTTPAELCTLAAAAPTDLVISNTWVDNGEYDGNYNYLPMDNVNIMYKSAEAEAFEAKYSYLMNITDAQLEEYYNFENTRFNTILADAGAAVGEINAGDDDFKATFATYSAKLNAIIKSALNIKSSIVTIDFEDGTMGDITVSNNGVNTGTNYTDPVIQTGFNTGATKQFFPGCNNSMYLANYFDKAVKSVSINMFFNGQWNNWEASSLIRKIEFDEHYSINVCVEGGYMHYRVYKDGAWYNEIQSHIITGGCEPNVWYTFVVSYDGNDVYASAKMMSAETFSTPVKICTLDAAADDLVVSTGWVEQSNSIYSLPIDDIAIQYYETTPFSISIEQGAYIRTKSENGFGNGISFKTIVTANPNFKAGTLAEFYYGTLAMDTENLGVEDSLLTYEMVTTQNSKGFTAKKIESGVAVDQLATVKDWRTSIVSSERKGTTVFSFGDKNQTVRSFIRYRLTSDPVGRYRFVYTEGNSVSRSYYQTAVNAYNANLSKIKEITGKTDLATIEGNTETNAVTALYYLEKYGYTVDAAITSHAVYQSLYAGTNS